MISAKAVATAFLAAMTMVGCASSEFIKDGASEQQFATDESLCRAQVRKMIATQRDIEDSRQETFRTEQQRFGQTTLPTAMSAVGERNRTARLLESCMQARGWQPKSPWWQRLGS